ncbi:MAG TPA: glycosyltransferase family 4 protein [Acholeplasmataceae bacterium]|nr:glycosyltransferase family 4 protein [Acholeplasmataceae bacterium]
MNKNNSNKSDSKKITFILGSMGKGGAERVISILANEYADKGWCVNIIMLLEDRCDYRLHPNVELIAFVNKNKGRVQQIPSWLIKIRKYVREHQPDKIVSFVARINILTILACIGLKVDIIISERNDPKSDGRSPIIRYATYLLYPLSKKVIFQTKWAQSCFPKNIREKSRIIYNPISITCAAKKNNSKKLVTVGRLAEQKNHMLLIDAFAKISERHSEYTLHIFGEGILRDLLKRKIQEIKLQDRVILEGNVSNIHERISDAEMFVLSSNYEGLSNALLEAMMMGLPCISTDCAGSNEVIKNGINGLLVPIKNSFSLSSAIEKLIKDKELASQLSINAVKDSIKFSSENVLEQWGEVIEDD